MKVNNEFLIQFAGLKQGKHQFEFDINKKFPFGNNKSITQRERHHKGDSILFRAYTALTKSAKTHRLK